MWTFRKVKLNYRIEGFQCHHIIPIEVVEHRALANFFGSVRATGFEPDDFATNGMHLPCVENQAAAFRLPLHRGAHPHYNRLVADRVAALVGLEPEDACLKLHELQAHLRCELRSDQLAASLKERDPCKSTADFRNLEAEVELLWGSTNQLARRWAA
jgi:hypothetical protein